MPMYRKILVAIDGSETSMHALKESFNLAEKETAINAVSVVPLYEGDLEFIGMSDVMASLRKPCEKALSAAAELAKASGIGIKTICAEGNPHQKIVELAEAENCGMIVMGRRGISRLERALVGSVTAKVIGYSHKDVLVVPRTAGIKFKNILVATDGSRYSGAAIEKAISLAKLCGSELKIISVADVPAEFYLELPQAVDDIIKKTEKYAEDAKRKTEEAGMKAEVHIMKGEAYKAITDIAREQKADIIIMGSHGRTGIKRLLMGSVTERVIGHAECAVLVVKTHD